MTPVPLAIEVDNFECMSERSMVQAALAPGTGEEDLLLRPVSLALYFGPGCRHPCSADELLPEAKGGLSAFKKDLA
jgi:hypothetical protein